MKEKSPVFLAFSFFNTCGLLCCLALVLLFGSVYAKLYHGLAFDPLPSFTFTRFLNCGGRVLRGKMGSLGLGETDCCLLMIPIESARCLDCLLCLSTFTFRLPLFAQQERIVPLLHVLSFLCGIVTRCAMSTQLLQSKFLTILEAAL